jgi:antitoxin HicB
MEYHFKIHSESDGFWAECIELDGCNTQAETQDELMSNMQEVLNLYLSEPIDSKKIFPLPSTKHFNKKNIVTVEVNPSVAFAFLLRMTRLKKKHTLRSMAKLLEYKSVNSYAKLEKPKTSNPELRTLGNILKKIPDFPVEFLFNIKKIA